MHTMSDAKKLKIIQLTLWLKSDELEWLQKEADRVLCDNSRTAIIVNYNSRYALFVNDVSLKRVC